MENRGFDEGVLTLETMVVNAISNGAEPEEATRVVEMLEECFETGVIKAEKADGCYIIDDKVAEVLHKFYGIETMSVCLLKK